MKKKYYALSVLTILMLNMGPSMASPTTDFSYIDDIQNPPNNTPNTPAIQGKSATGENQTTVVDQNGNLKMIEGPVPHSNGNMVPSQNTQNTMKKPQPAAPQSVAPQAGSTAQPTNPAPTQAAPTGTAPFMPAAPNSNNAGTAAPPAGTGTGLPPQGTQLPPNPPPINPTPPATPPAAPAPLPAGTAAPRT